MAQNLTLEVKTINHEQDSISGIYFQQRKFDNFNLLNESISKAKEQLESSGYFNYIIDSLNFKSETVCTIEFDSGKKIDKIQISTKDELVKNYLKKLNLNYKDTYFILPLDNLNTTLNQFTAFEAQNKFATTSFQLKNLVIRNAMAFATLYINRQESKSNVTVAIKGYPEFPNAFTKHYLKLNGRVDKNYLLEKAETFYKLPFIEQLKEPEVLISNQDIKLYLYTSKTKANRFEGFLGFRNNENNTKVKLDGNIEINLLNNFNYGESLDFIFNNGNNQQSLNLATRLPFLFKSPISFGAQLNLFRKDSTFSTSYQKIILDYFITSNTQIDVFTSLEKSTLLLTETALLLNDYTKNEMGVNVKHSSFPVINKLKSPYELNLKLGLINRKTPETKTKDNQLKLEFNALYLLQFTNKHHLLLESTNKILESKTFYTNELFRLGGIKSIRGFRENQLLANRYHLILSEYRYITSKKIYFNTITDFGLIENKNQDELNFIYSIGLGTTISTRAGAIQINFANGNQTNQNFTLSNTILHIGLKTQF
ncbi:hypothetical protein [Leeuwenhoekiella sp. W20_SRS_FM14]|uniref:hypothetical protein n=1 Tax=Leeuwenhoekiella sp. W20_SRS_FM14 TaxID=3240270 RepID=UPI003F9A2FBF